jgi:hypothetical protein
VNLYYKARQMALANRQPFHVVAILLRGKSVIRIAVNGPKTSPRNRRKYDDGKESFHHHAETAALIWAKPGDQLIVLRYRKSGDLVCARPCVHCEERLKKAPVEVFYSDWDGIVRRY